METNFEHDFEYNEIKYAINISKLENHYTLRITKPLDLYYWETQVDFLQLQKQFPFLYAYDEDTFAEHFLGYCILNLHFILKPFEECIILTFWTEIQKGKEQIKKEFQIKLAKLKGEVGDNISNLATHIQKFEKNYEIFQNSIETKLIDIDQRSQNHLENFMRDVMETNDRKFREIEESVRSFLDEQKMLLNLKLNQITYELSKTFGNKLYPAFLNSNNANFSNDNRTITKTGNTAWYGHRCSEIPIEPGKYSFSIRIDQTDVNCYIMLGFCLNTHNEGKGFYDSNCLVMFYLANGQIYCPNPGNGNANNFKGIQGMIVTAVIDTTCQMAYFLANDILCQAPKYFNINQADFSRICPCVDLYTSNDQVTIYQHS